jgi:uncharacterized membrane protein (DUF106 family)
MTAADILRIATTVGTVQLLCDLFANWRVYGKEPYQRAVESLSRAKWKRDKAVADAAETAAAKQDKVVTAATASNGKKSSKVDKHAKRLQRVEDDFSEAASQVARRHTVPSICTSIIFVILLRVLGTEYKGNMVGVLPFEPFRFLQRVTGRGLEFGDLDFESVGDKVTDISQACSFVFIYMLCGMSVKVYVSRLFGTQPPKGADGGIMTVMDSPTGQKLMKTMGIDPAEYKEFITG